MQNGDRPSIESAFLPGLAPINILNLAGISQSIPFFGWYTRDGQTPLNPRHVWLPAIRRHPLPRAKRTTPPQSANTPDKRRINASAYSSRDNHAITARFTHGGDNCPAQYSAVNNPPTGRCTRRLCACRQAASAISSASSLSPRRRNTGGW